MHLTPVPTMPKKKHCDKLRKEHTVQTKGNLLKDSLDISRYCWASFREWKNTQELLEMKCKRDEIKMVMRKAAAQLKTTQEVSHNPRGEMGVF